MGITKKAMQVGLDYNKYVFSSVISGFAHFILPFFSKNLPSRKSAH